MFKGVNKTTSKAPLPVIFLQGLISEWEATPPVIVAYPRNAEFDKLFMRPQQVGFTGETVAWEFIAFTNIIPKAEMDEKKRELYRTLKNLECELRWEGLLRRKPRFRPFAGLLELRKISGLAQALEPRDELGEALSHDALLSRLIMQSGLNELAVFLLSDTVDFPSPEEDVVSRMARFYAEPPEVTWIIRASTTFTFPIERMDRNKCEAIFVQVFKALDRVSRILKDLTLTMRMEFYETSNENVQ